MDPKKIIVEDMEFETVKEEWCEYMLEDGVMIKIKLIATEIRKVVGEYDELGRPVYHFKFQTVNRMIYPKVKNPQDLVS